MPSGPNLGYGMQRLLDAHQRFFNAALPFYLRTKNFQDTQNQLWSQLGFSIAPTGAPAGASNSPVVFSFFAAGLGTQHYITVGTQTYGFVETAGMSSAQVAVAMATVAATTLGASITADPNVLTSSGSNQVTLTPANNSGAVVQLSASDNNASALMWVTNTPGATLAAVVGTTDTLITPTPVVTMLSMHNIVMSEGKLRFGARVIRVSQSFVSAQANALGLPMTPTGMRQVWEAANVVGLVSENLLFSIEDVKHSELGGTTVYWDLTCNANELR